MLLGGTDTPVAGLLVTDVNRAAHQRSSAARLHHDLQQVAGSVVAQFKPGHHSSGEVGQSLARQTSAQILI